MSTTGLAAFDHTVDVTNGWLKDLGEQLPMLVRGFHYEGWHPAGKPLKERKREQFLAHVAAACAGETTHPEVVTRSVFKLLKARVTDSEIQDIKRNLPHELQYLWE